MLAKKSNAKHGLAYTLFGSCSEPHHLFADIAARQHVDEGGGSLLEAFGDRLAPFEVAGAIPCHQLAERLVAARQVIADAEPLQPDALVEDDTDVAQALPLAGVLLRDLTTDRHPSVGVEVVHHDIEDIAADVVEIDVDALRSGIG
jgi:hypothetical protein